MAVANTHQDRTPRSDILDALLPVLSSVMPSMYYLSFLVAGYTIVAVVAGLLAFWYFSIAILAPLPYGMPVIYLLSFVAGITALFVTVWVWRQFRETRRAYMHFMVAVSEDEAYTAMQKDLRAVIRGDE